MASLLCVVNICLCPCVTLFATLEYLQNSPSSTENSNTHFFCTRLQAKCCFLHAGIHFIPFGVLFFCMHVRACAYSTYEYMKTERSDSF